MPKYITIEYGDQAGYDRTAKHLRDAAMRLMRSAFAKATLWGRGQASAGAQS